eukprot:RCo017330
MSDPARVRPDVPLGSSLASDSDSASGVNSTSTSVVPPSALALPQPLAVPCAPREWSCEGGVPGAVPSPTLPRPSRNFAGASSSSSSSGRFPCPTSGEASSASSGSCSLPSSLGRVAQDLIQVTPAVPPLRARNPLDGIRASATLGTLGSPSSGVAGERAGIS